MQSPRPQREVLFISYQATEQKTLAEWLSFKLAAEGFYVWIDSKELLGGDAFDVTIDEVIRNRTFRMIALVSATARSSWAAKERGLAQNLATARDEPDFLIPLVTDGATRDQLNFTLSNVALIPFTNWAEGLTQLLDKLEKIRAPRRDPSEAKCWVAQHALNLRGFEAVPEPIFTNFFPFTSVPRYLREYRFRKSLSREEERGIARKWPFYGVGGCAFAFEEVPDDLTGIFDPGPVHSVNVPRLKSQSTSHMLQPLISRHVSRHLRERGLLSEDERHISFYFPHDKFSNVRLPYMLNSLRRSRKQVCGLRNHDRDRYSTRVDCCVRSMLGVDWGVVLRLGVLFVHADGSRYDPRLEFALSRAMTKSWFNSQWLGLQKVVMAFIADQQPFVSISRGQSDLLTLSAVPVETELPFRLVDKQLKNKTDPSEGVTDESENRPA